LAAAGEPAAPLVGEKNLKNAKKGAALVGGVRGTMLTPRGATEDCPGLGRSEGKAAAKGDQTSPLPEPPAHHLAEGGTKIKEG